MPRPSEADRPLTARDLDVLRAEVAALGARVDYLTKALEAGASERDNLQKIVSTFLIRFEPVLTWAEGLRIGDGDDRLSLDRRLDKIKAQADENRRRINWIIAGATAIAGALGTITGVFVEQARSWINRW